MHHIAISACLIALACLLLFLPSATAQTNPPANGDWTVSDTTALSGGTVVLNGNLVVKSGGRLTLTSVDLRFASTYPGQYRAEVESGGTLVLDGGTVDAADGATPYHFRIRAGATADIKNTVFRRCGTGWGPDPQKRGEDAGLYIASDAVTLNGVAVSDSFAGAWVQDASPAINDSTFSRNTFGLLVDGGAGRYKGNTLARNSADGLNANRTKGLFRWNVLQDNGDTGVTLANSDALVENTTVSGSPIGLVLLGGTSTVRDSLITGMTSGLRAYRANATVATTSFVSNSRYGLYLYRSNLTLDRATVIGGTTGLMADYSGVTVLNTTFSGQDFAGLYLSNSGYRFENSTATLAGYDTSTGLASGTGLYLYRSNGTVNASTFTLDGRGVFLAWSSAAARGNIFTSNGVGMEVRLNGDFTPANITGNRFVQNTAGLLVNGSGALVANNSFERNADGLTALESWPVVQWNTFQANTRAGLNCTSRSVQGSNPWAWNNTFTGDADGVRGNGCTGRFFNNTVNRPQKSGFYFEFSSVMLDRNTVAGAGAYGIHLFGSVASVWNTTVTGSGGAGVMVDGGQVDLRDSTLKGNREGVTAVDSKVDIQRNAVSSSTAVGLNLTGSGTVHDELKKYWGAVQANDISGSPTGIRIASSWPPLLVISNDIRGNSVGIDITGTYNATFRANRLTANSAYGFRLYDATVELTSNTVSGSEKGVAATASSFGGPQFPFSGNTVTGNTYGIHLASTAAIIASSTLSSNGYGLFVLGGTVVTTGNAFTGNSVGLHAEDAAFNSTGDTVTGSTGSGGEFVGAQVEMHGTVFDGNGAGIYVGGTGKGQVARLEGVRVRSNRGYGMLLSGVTGNIADPEFSSNGGEGLLLDGALLYLSNGLFAGNAGGGIADRGGSVVAWTVRGWAESRANSLRFTGNITVFESGSILLNSTDLYMGAGSVPGNITVRGAFTAMNGSKVLAADISHPYSFVVERSGSLTLKTATVSGCGYEWGSDGRTAGLFIATPNADISFSTFSRNYYGVVVSGTSPPAFRRVAFTANAVGVTLARGGTLHITDSGFDGNSIYDVDVRQSSRLDIENTTMTPSKAAVEEDSWLYVWWYVRLSVTWQNGNPVMDAVEVDIADITGTSVFKGVSDYDGTLGPLLMLEFSRSGETTLDWTPHEFTASYKMFTRSEDVRVTSSRTVVIALTDPDPPSVTIESPLNGTVQNDTVVLFAGGAADGGSGLDSVMLSTDGGATWEKSSRPERWGRYYAMDEGNFTLTVRVADRAGNIVEESRHVSVDIQPPFLNISWPTDGLSTSSSVLYVCGTTEPGASVEINGAKVKIGPDQAGRFSKTLFLSEGSNDLVFVVRDAVYNARRVSRTVTLDTTPPDIVVHTPTAGSLINKAIVEVDGETEAGASLTAQGLPVETEGDGHFNIRMPLAVEGRNIITFVAVDGAGNTNSLDLYLERDTTPPHLTILAPKAGKGGRVVTKAETIAVAGITEKSARVTVNGVPATVDPMGTFNISVILVDGNNDISVRATDPAGNMQYGYVPVFKQGESQASSSDWGEWAFVGALFALFVVEDIVIILYLKNISILALIGGLARRLRPAATTARGPPYPPPQYRYPPQAYYRYPPPPHPYYGRPAPPVRYPGLPPVQQPQPPRVHKKVKGVDREMLAQKVKEVCACCGDEIETPSGTVTEGSFATACECGKMYHQPCAVELGMCRGCGKRLE